jgi:hypothetical protein
VVITTPTADERQTASTVKVAILGAVLLRAQEAKRPLTAWEHALAPISPA